jgi:hypothetical protein
MGHRGILTADMMSFLRRGLREEDKEAKLERERVMEAMIWEVLAVICVYSTALQRAYHERLAHVDRVLARGIKDPFERSGETKCANCGKRLKGLSVHTRWCPGCRRNDRVQACVVALREELGNAHGKVDEAMSRWLGTDSRCSHDTVGTKLVEGKSGVHFDEGVVCIALSIMDIPHLKDDGSQCPRVKGDLS